MALNNSQPFSARVTAPSQQAKAGTSSVATTSNCRLLWRGTFVADGLRLPGLALVAHLFAVPSSSSQQQPTLFALSPSQLASPLSPFADPFLSTSVSSSSSSSPASALAASQGATMCLGIEMLRNADIHMLPLDDFKIACKSHPALKSDSGKAGKDSVGKARKYSAADKGKGKGKEAAVEVEVPTELRLYVDPRAGETVAWFEKRFCSSSREGMGLKLDVGGDEMIVFATPRPLSSGSLSPENQSNPHKPAVNLVVGRRVAEVIRKPRPDDPLPRENLFAHKLRQTISLPSMPPMIASMIPSTKPNSSSKWARSASANALFAGAAGSRPGKNGLVPPPPVLAKKEAKRPKLSSSSSSSTLGATLAPPSASSSSTSKAKESRKREKLAHRRSSRSASLAPPETIQEEEHEEGDGLLGSDLVHRPRLKERRSSSSLAPPSLPPEGAEAIEAGQKRKGLKRAISLPVGQGLFQPALPPARATRDSRSASLAPPDANGNGQGSDVESRNKAAIKKAVLAALVARGVDRGHEEFGELFSVTSKGTAVALRAALRAAERIERDRIAEVVERHLGMYLLVPLTTEEQAGNMFGEAGGIVIRTTADEEELDGFDVMDMDDARSEV